MKYLVQDNVDYACCALLSAINARRFLDGAPMAELGTDEFEVLVDLTYCRNGAALDAWKARRLFDLHWENGPHCIKWIMGRLSEGRPVELSVFSPDWGHHSVLCIGATHEHAYLVNWKRGSPITEVPWSKIVVPLYAQNRAKAYALRE